jgi:hypothetical protein
MNPKLSRAVSSSTMNQVLFSSSTVFSTALMWVSRLDPDRLRADERW